MAYEPSQEFLKLAVGTPPMPKVQPPAQGQLKLKPEMTPLALLYLLSIYNGDFDQRLHAGHFSTNVQFRTRVRDLMDMGFIAYDGQHCLKPAGAAHVEKLLELKP